MIKITKNEAAQIRKRHPWAHIVETSKRKPARARSYYMTEEKKLLDTLNRIRGNSASGDKRGR